MPGMMDRRYSETTARQIDDAVRGLIEAAFGKAVSLLKERRGILDKAAKELLAKETLAGEELAALVGGAPYRGAATTERAAASRASA